MGKRVYALLACALLFCGVITAPVTARDYSFHDEKVSDFDPYWVVSAGVSARLDEREWQESSPTYHLEFLRYVAEPVGLKFGAEYTNSTKEKVVYQFTGMPEQSQIRHFAFGAGIRSRFYRKTVAPYFEGNLQFHRYWIGDLHAGESKLGLNFGVGTEIHVSKSFSVDLYLNHTVNSIATSQAVYAAPAFPHDVVYGSGPTFSSHLFNPTSVRFSLTQRL